MKNLIIGLILVISACTSVQNSGSAYFRSHKKIVGVESLKQVVERADRPAKLRQLMYAELSYTRLIHCTILRNQLYVAALTHATKEIRAAANSLEKAYQQDDQSFLSVCDQIAKTALGQRFAGIAKLYLGPN